MIKNYGQARNGCGNRAHGADVNCEEHHLYILNIGKDFVSQKDYAQIAKRCNYQTEKNCLYKAPDVSAVKFKAGKKDSQQQHGHWGVYVSNHYDWFLDKLGQIKRHTKKDETKHDCNDVWVCDDFLNVCGTAKLVVAVGPDEHVKNDEVAHEVKNTFVTKHAANKRDAYKSAVCKCNCYAVYFFFRRKDSQENHNSVKDECNEGCKPELTKLMPAEFHIKAVKY